MAYSQLKEAVYAANMALVTHHLVLFTWGNASQVDRQNGVFAIKPSGVAYDALRPQDIVVLDMDGRVVEGSLKPSSDTETHRVLYQKFPDIGGVTHTHSTYATIWAQAGQSMPCYGTTHADTFNGAVPCTRPMNPREIAGEYEYETGRVIVEAFAVCDYRNMHAVLVHGHGPFTWGGSAMDSVENAAVLEQCALLAHGTRVLNPQAAPISEHLLGKHFLRKHGAGSYYGQ